LDGRKIPGAKTPLISEENSPAGRLQAEKWGEKTPDISGDLGGKKILGAKPPHISQENSGIRRVGPEETRSKLHIEAKMAAR